MPTTGERIRAALEILGTDSQRAIAELAAVYAPDCVFQDPIQTVHGRDGFIAANQRLVRRARQLTMTIHSMIETDEEIVLTWSMVYALKLGGPRAVIEGATHLFLRDHLVLQHRDYWDLLGSFMDAIPILGRIYRLILSQLG